MEKFEEVFEKWANVDKELKDECLSYIKKAIDEAPDKEIVFPNDENFDPVFICYDGGHHSEYASNVFSMVQGLSYRYNDYYVETEDADFELNYIVYNVDLYEIALGIQALKDIDSES